MQCKLARCQGAGFKIKDWSAGKVHSYIGHLLDLSIYFLFGVFAWLFSACAVVKNCLQCAEASWLLQSHYCNGLEFWNQFHDIVLMLCWHIGNCVSIICLLLLCGLQTCNQCVQSAVCTVVNILQFVVSGKFESLHSLQFGFFGLHSCLAEAYGLQVFVLSGRPVHPTMYKQVT